MSDINKFLGSLPAVKNPVEIPLSAPISKVSREVVLAYSNFPKVFEYKDKNFIGQKVTEYIGVTFFYVGIKAENMHKEDLMLYYRVVVGDIYNDFSGLTIQEIELAFRMGVRGHLGEFHGINPATFYKWLKTYIATIKVTARQEYKAIAPKPEEKVLNKEEKIKYHNHWVRSVIIAYDKFIETEEHTFFDAGDLLYKALTKNPSPMLVLPLSKCRELWNRSIDLVKINNSPAKARNIGERSGFNQISEFISKGIGNLGTKQSVKFQKQKEFKRMAIMHYWTDCKKFEFDFKTEFSKQEIITKKTEEPCPE